MSQVESGTRHVPTYCYQCVAGPDLLTVKVVDGVATEVEPNFCAADVHPGGGKVCVKAYGLVQKTYNPHRILTPMKRTNPKKGRDEDPGFVPISWDEAFDLVAAKLNEIRAGKPDRRVGLSAARGEPRRRRHAAVVHGHVPRIPRRVGAGRHGLRLGSGREVLSLRAPVRRVLAPRLHRVARHAAVRLPDLLRRERRGVRRRRRRLAPRQRAHPRDEARPGRAASVGHRRLLGRVGADQAQDRRRVPLRARPRAAARIPAAAARRRVPRAVHGIALPRRPPRLLPARPGDEEAAGLGFRAPRGGPVRRDRYRGGARRPLRGRRRRARSGWRRARRRAARRRNRRSPGSSAT